MALISFALFPFRFPGRRAGVAFAVCVALCGCEMRQDDNTAAPGNAADAASAAEAPEPASGWRFVRIGASAAEAGASMSARVKDDRRLSRDRGALVADSTSSAASTPPPDAASASTARRPVIAAAAASADAATLARGRYLALAGDCAACHDAADHTPYAGG